MSFDGPYDHGDGPPPAAGWWEQPREAVPPYSDQKPPDHESPGDLGRGSSCPNIKATRFAWRDPSEIPPREWLYGKHLIRGFVSALFAPGGLGKTSLGVVDALALVSGAALIGDRPHGAVRVWMINLEDPREEMERRITAAAMHHNVDKSVLDERLYLDVGREQPIVTAEMTKDGAKIMRPVMDALECQILDKKIDVVIVDPFVSSHRVTENDNMAIDLVVKEWAALAGRANCSVELVHHVRKLRGEDATAEDGRGGGSLLAAVRSARVLNGMSPEAAKGYGISETERRRYFRVDDGKANLAPPGAAKWCQLVSVPLGNQMAGRPEDWIGVVVAWTPPNPLDDISVSDLPKIQQAINGKGMRENVQANDWVGKEIAKVLGIVLDDPGKSKVKGLIKIWLKSGALKKVEIKDADGDPRPCIDVGIWSV